MTTSFKHLDLADLPALKQDSLCRMLDKNNHWLDLGQRMQFSFSDLESIKTESLRLRKSATDLLINKWTIYGHNVTELFKLLADMQHFVAMHEIKDLVDKRYHIWLKAVPATVMGPTQVIGEPAVVLNGTSRANSTQEDEQENLKDKLNIPEVSIKALEDATNKWAEENVLGKGGYGVVYRGELWATRVAIKKSEFRGTRSVKDNLLQSVNELRHLNHCRHDNILPIYGFAFQDDTLFMVTQLMLGGSLEDKLPRDRENLREGFVPLTWEQRWTIAQGTARGLHYLHRYNAKPLVHGDIKPGNILLDLSFEPKIADFGFSREGFFNDECHQISRAFGTRPYAAPEFIRMKSFSAKNDVFSFGVVLFELATALSPLNGQRPCPFLFDLMAEVDENLKPNIMEVIDHSMGNDETCFNFCKMLISLGKNCTDSIPNRRPEMIEVLEGLKRFQPTPVTPPAVSEIDSAIFDSDDSSC